jgi:tripartite-type tricarboxylate transporter receptor subunit TctC
MRERPKKLTFASGSVTTRAGAELLQEMTKTEAVHVPYKGDPPALNDIMGGQIDFMTVNFVPGVPLIKSGKLRAIAVTSTSRIRALPNIPTVQETPGLEGFEMTTAGAAFVPAGTPAAIVLRLNKILSTAANSDELKNFMESTGGESLSSTPKELEQFVRSEHAKWARIVKMAGIEPE